MSNKLLKLSTLISGMASSLLLLPARAFAACSGGTGIQDGIECGKTNNLTVTGGVQTTVNTLLFVVGVSAVIVLIVGGLRYVLSGGDPKATAGAKDTILYAVIGIVVALLAYAIVNFVLTQFS